MLFKLAFGNKFDSVIKMVKVNPGSSYENIGSTGVPGVVYQVSVHRSLGSEEEDFLSFSPCDMEQLNKFSAPTSHGGAISNLASINLAVSEQKKFEKDESE